MEHCKVCGMTVMYQEPVKVMVVTAPGKMGSATICQPCAEKIADALDAEQDRASMEAVELERAKVLYPLHPMFV